MPKRKSAAMVRVIEISLRILGPFVFWISAAELAAGLWLESLPESGDVGCRLHRALIGSEQVHDKRDLAVGNPRRLAHAEEILEPRGDPWRFAGFIVDSRLTSAGQTNTAGRDFIESLPSRALFEQRDHRLRSGLQFSEALEALAEFAEGRLDIKLRNRRVLCGEGGAGEEAAQLVRIDEALNAGFNSSSRKQRGGWFRIGHTRARFLDDQLIVEQGTDCLDALAGAIPFDSRLLAHAVREQIDQPFRLDGREEANQR